jgi:hypothetical protein
MAGSLGGRAPAVRGDRAPRSDQRVVVVSLMRTPVANAVVPVGWPPLAGILSRTRALGIPINV